MRIWIYRFRIRFDEKFQMSYFLLSITNAFETMIRICYKHLQTIHHGCRADNARGGVISIAIHESTNLLYGANGGGSLYKIPLRSLAEIEAPDIFDSLIIPLFSVLSRGLGGWYIFQESSVSMSLN